MVDKCSVLLIYPPSRTQMHYHCPMGLLMVAAVLEKAGYRIKLLDANAAGNKQNMNDVVKIVHHFKPDIIGMTLITTLAKEAYKLASLLKNNGSKLIAGGPHATIIPKEALEHGFDAVVIGEGESTIEEAIQGLMGQIPMENVKGIAYKDNEGQIIETKPREYIEDLDSLPPPARHLVNPLDYGPSYNPQLHTNLFSSRGCTGRCSFCAGGLFGKKFRFRSAQNILDEIFYLYKNYGTRHFHFVDDAMTTNKDRVKKICEGINESDMSITFSLMTRFDRVNDDMLALLSQAGCNRIDFGVESGHPETLKKIHKPHSVEMVKRVVPLTAKYKIKPLCFFILGFPWEDTNAIQNTKELIVELSPYVIFHQAIGSILIPFPGTEIYDKYKHEYNLENWWLKEDRSFKAPDVNKSSYFESKIFWAGDVININFFNYSDEVKQKIIEVFKYMYVHSLRRFPFPVRVVQWVPLELSQKMNAFSPRFEKIVFSPVRKMEQIAINTFKLASGKTLSKSS